MDDIAQQLDDVRREIAQLLSTYPSATDDEKQEILNECEFLGGEVQELVGVLKLSIRQIMDATRSLHEDESPEYDHLTQIANCGIRVAHCAGEEVSAAVRLIRQLRGDQVAGEL
ncbi:MAG: hypothetical protein GY842_24270 [bacterium]|nr:hypothetical protein [bacterium]